MSNKNFSEATQQEAMWRSKLGTNYPKAMMQKNEARHLACLRSIRDSCPENSMCADCGMKGTVWASVNLGVFLCMTCGAHHRSLGTHISVPKGCTGTYWWGPDELEQMKSTGNRHAQQVYGASSPPQGLSKDGDSTLWKKYLVDKYVHRKYAPTSKDAVHAQEKRTGASATKKPTPTFDFQQFDQPQTKAKTSLPAQTTPPNDTFDLMSFDDSPVTRKAAVPAPKATSTPLPPVDFFASFGL